MVKHGLIRERLLHIAIEIDCKQSATIVSGEWYSRVLRCRECLRPRAGIASGQLLLEDIVAKLNFRRLVAHRFTQKFFPESARFDMRGDPGAFGIDGKLLPIAFAFGYGIHKVIINEQAAIDACNRPHSCTGIDKSFRVGVLYAQRERDRGAGRQASYFLPRTSVALQRTDNVRCSSFRLFCLKLSGINPR